MSTHALTVCFTLAIATPLLLLSYRSLRSGSEARSWLLLLLAAIVIRWCFASYGYLHPWDERYHAVVARHLLDHPFTPMLYPDPLHSLDVADWKQNGIWLHKPPAALWLIAGSVRLFGFTELAVRLPSLIAGALAPLLTYSIAKRLGQRSLVAWFAAMLHITNGFLLEVGSGQLRTDHVDALLAVAVELAIYFAIRHHDSGRKIDLAACGVATGAAVLTKWLPGLLPLCVLLVLPNSPALGAEHSTRQPWARTLCCALIATCVFLPWTLYTRHAFAVEAALESHYNWEHIWVAAEGHTGDPLYHLKRLPVYFGELAPVAIVFFAHSQLRHQTTAGRALLVWFCVPYLFFSLVATKMPAYVITAAPAIFIMIASCAETIWARSTWKHRAVALMLIAMPLRIFVDRTKLFRDASRTQPWSESLKALAAQLPDTPPAVVYNLDHPIEAMFYMRHQAYSGLPTQAELEKASARGMRVIIIEGANVPPDWRTDPSVQVIPLPGQNKVGNESAN